MYFFLKVPTSRSIFWMNLYNINVYSARFINNLYYIIIYIIILLYNV